MSYSPWMGNLFVQNTPGNYGTVKIFIDESSTSSPQTMLSMKVEIAGKMAQPTDFEVEVFTNLNRRDFVRFHEPLEIACTDSSYWLSYPMRYVGNSYDNFVYELTLPVNKCGVYRLTTRYRRIGSQSWWWNNDFSPTPYTCRHRDTSIVVSPEKVKHLRLYEANALTVEAVAGGSYENRSTLDDFLPTHDFDGFNPFELEYITKNLGYNALWLMPVFPGTQWRWDRANWKWADNNNPGSPYSVRDYWSINPWLADTGEKERALELFKELVNHADALKLDIFLDMAFNHAGRDVVYGDGAVELGLCQKEVSNSWIREVRPGWCTRGNEFINGQAIIHYREPASNSFECSVWAPADRLNEHIWDDANIDWYFGDYSSLGPKPFHQATDYWGNTVYCRDDRGNAEDEQDLFYTNLAESTETANLWKYFAHILPYWLTLTDRKIAGMRADFAQGLPNQLWEYIINKTRQTRWDFIFLGEVLDPDTIQYRMNRVFDALTTKDHHLYRKNDTRMSQLFGSLESEARLFGSSSIVMHNGTSHDEEGNSDKWAMVARYAVAASLQGVPMIFMGQPLGQDKKMPFREQWSNMYEYWIRPDSERTPVMQMYQRINNARNNSPELTGHERYFLNQTCGCFYEEIFSVARWINKGDYDSVILVFVNLDTTRTHEACFEIPRYIRLSGDYQICNLVADDPAAKLWSDYRSAEDIYTNGIYVRFWYPNETQYLKLIRK